MIHPRTAALGVAVAALLTLGVGVAAARVGAEAPARRANSQNSTNSQNMDEMHARMHQQMAGQVDPEMLEQCDEMHAQMHSGAGGMGSMMGR